MRDDKRDCDRKDLLTGLYTSPHKEYISFMNNISITQLKINPSQAITNAADYPVAIENRNEVKAYLLSKDMYSKFISFIEDKIDSLAVSKANFKKSKDLEKIVKELGL